MGKSPNVYAVYKVRVISQNRRRKVITEDVSLPGPSSSNCRFKIIQNNFTPLFIPFAQSIQVSKYFNKDGCTKIWLLDFRRYCMYVYKILHTNRYVPPPPCPGWGKLKSHVLHYALVRSLKNAPCLGPNVSVGNGPRWRLKDTLTAAIFCCKSTDISPLILEIRSGEEWDRESWDTQDD